uniref:Uncharacterized protein n=1 Tax=Arundo donax TaxID=35708 RepID=A0A0A9C6I0_ARUDO
MRPNFFTIHLRARTGIICTFNFHYMQNLAKQRQHE